MTTPEPVTFADLAQLYEQATSAPPGGLYNNIFRDGLIEAVGVYVQQDDPTVEIAYLKAKVADLSDEYPTRWTQGRRPPMSHDDIRAALEAATPGPWAYHADQHRDDGRVWRLGGDGDDICRLAYPDREADAHLIANAPTWLAELLAEVDRLARWKTEALPVITGLQELGSALGIPLGKRITGLDALVAVKALTARAEAAEQAIQRVRGLAEAWATQPNDYDENTEQQIEDGKAILRALDGGEQHG